MCNGKFHQIYFSDSSYEHMPAWMLNDNVRLGLTFWYLTPWRSTLTIRVVVLIAVFCWSLQNIKNFLKSCVYHTLLYQASLFIIRYYIKLVSYEGTTCFNDQLAVNFVHECNNRYYTTIDSKIQKFYSPKRKWSV